MQCRFPGANNPNPFFIFAIRIGVDNQQDHYGSDRPDRMPPLFAIFKAVRHYEMKRISEHLLGQIERDAVLGKVAPGFFKVPFELQNSTVDLQ
jgi:hypothetical protein